MGLRKADAIPAIVICVSAVFEAWGAAGRELLRYDRAAIAAGEAWRLLSGHFVHLGVPHLLMNAAGLGLVWFLYGREFGAVRWIWIVILTVAGISSGFWVLDPQLNWYVGLSGLLHGLLAAGIVGALLRQRRDAALLAILVTAKLAWEQIVGPLPGSEGTAGGTVIVNAHLYGTLSGAVAGAIMSRLENKKEKRSQ